MTAPISAPMSAPEPSIDAPRAHITVLLHEAVDALMHADADPNGLYVDGTFGRGGHSRLILEKLGKDGRLIDPCPVQGTQAKLASAKSQFTRLLRKTSTNLGRRLR